MPVFRPTFGTGWEQLRLFVLLDKYLFCLINAWRPRVLQLLISEDSAIPFSNS